MVLQATPFDRASEMALEIYSDVLDAVRSDRVITQSVSREGDQLIIQGKPYNLTEYNGVWIAGVGKASVEMARALRPLVGSAFCGGLVITKADPAQPLGAVDGIEVIQSAHPVPDERSLAAGARMLEFARERKAGDLVLFVLSGGASALMESLVDELSLEALQATNRALLASGAPIGLVNAVRSRVSRIKAGGLARAFRDATVVTLVLSDVIGNSLATIGSGPLFAPHMIDISSELLDVLPSTVRIELLARSLSEPRTPEIPHFVIGSISLAIQAAASSARERGLDARAFADPLVGEARDMARRIMAVTRRQAALSGPFALIFGGETTVTLRGSGKGGRCQEMATAAASALGRLPGVAFLAAGTDGGDGPTEAAGGLVDGGSVARAATAGVSPRSALVRNDSYAFLKASGGLIVTGPTGSNVNDICLVVRAN